MIFSFILLEKSDITDECNKNKSWDVDSILIAYQWMHFGNFFIIVARAISIWLLLSNKCSTIIFILVEILFQAIILGV